MYKKVIFNILIILPILVQAQNPSLSEGWYRIPYTNGTEVQITRDWVDHGNNGGSQASENVGRIDMVAVNGVGTLVAAADGIVTNFFDGRRDCGCHNSYANCATNFVTIQHPNGERSQYVHVAFNSVVVAINQSVTAGQIIATEGDVGYTCGNTRPANNLGNTCPTVQVDSATGCGRHLHFTVTRPGVFLNPRICSPDVADDYFIFKDNATYTANPCGTSTCQDTSFLFLNRTFDDEMKSYPVVDKILTLGSVLVDSVQYTAIDFQAGSSILLTPGFTAVSGTFFRASIQPCQNNTLMEIESSD